MYKKKNIGGNHTEEAVHTDLSLEDSRKFFPQGTPDQTVYQPLNLTEDSIRVIKVLPGPEKSVIRCTMRNTTITGTEYACLSYTWQPSAPEHTIDVNGHPVLVGNNLFQFLHAYRSCNASPSLNSSSNFNRLLWIDAISINQTDIREKNHQVRSMRAIYKTAVGVIVWLGELSQELGRFFEDLAYTEDICSLVANWPENASDIICSQVKQQIDALEPSQKEQLRDRASSLIGLPYWNRIWIAQELLSRSGRNSLFVFSGRRLFNMFYLQDELLTIINAFTWPWHRGKDQKEPVFNQAFPMCLKYLLWLGAYSHGPKEIQASLPSLLTHFYYCGCKDRRDRIFALMSLAHAEPRVEIDYEVESVTLFQTVLEAFMVTEPLDKMLRFGASLIQALGIRQTSCKTNNAIRDKSDDSPLLISRPHSGVVARPVWAETMLEFPPNEEHTRSSVSLRLQKAMLCIYVGIFDVRNIHIFEYAVEEDEDGVVVKYARAYDYLRGVPQSHEIPETFCTCGQSRFMWLNMPSEKVHYLKGPFDGFLWRRNTPLVAWSTPNFEIVEDNPESSDDVPLSSQSTGYQRLKSAVRSWRDDVLWSVGVEYHWHTSVFLSAHEEINSTMESLQMLVSLGEDQPVPLDPRATKMVIFRDRTEAERTISPQIEPTIDPRLDP